MKTNLNTHDVYALVTELQYLIGAQVVNVYDITSQMICIKLRCKYVQYNELFNYESEKTELEAVEALEVVETVETVETVEESEKKKHFLKYLIIESSTKFYVLDEFTAINIIPSSFSSKLRKHLKNKRISKFDQINLDRVIDIQFGTNDPEKKFYCNHLMCEFYASGNIILTDNNYKIMTLIHPYVYKDGESQQNLARVSVGNIYPLNFATVTVSLEYDYIKQIIIEELNKTDKKIKAKQFMMKLPLITFSPSVLEHALIVAGILPNEKIDNCSDIFSDEKILQIIATINKMFNLKTFNGYIIDDVFLPYLYNQYKDSKFTEYSSFSESVTKHFLKFDKFESKEKKAEITREKKLSKQDKILVNIQNQISSFESKVEENAKIISSIELDINLLQDFLNYVSCYMVDPVKKPINFTGKFEQIQLLEYIPYKNEITFVFNGAEYKWNTHISAHANMGNKFKENKQIKQKIEKATTALTIASTVNAKKDSTDTEQVTVTIKGKSKEFWFEEFNWFVTSDGLMFVSGKTADQNEQLVKKYLNANDLYIHSEIFGSGSGILKNNGNVIIEKDCPKSIEECGNFLICHTKAWKDSVPDRAYWVYPNQVSKKTETGEYVSKGAFIVRGTKNFIPTQKMELGLAILFKSLNSDELKYQAGDDIEFAMPMVATYSALSEHKFKVKITPGTQKIKKVFPEVLTNFYKKSNMFEKTGIKLISNDDFQKVLVTGVRFHLHTS